MSRGARPDTEVLVVGCGIAGVALLHALATLGIDALGIDAAAGAAAGAGTGVVGAAGAGTGVVGTAGAGASGLPAALLNPYRGRTGRATALDAAGLASFWRLVDELEGAGYASGAHRGGLLRVAASPRQAARWRGLTGPLPLARHEFPAHVHAPHGGMLVEPGGWVEPVRLLAALRGAAQAAGAAVCDGVSLLPPGDDGEVGVMTVTGPSGAGVMTAQTSAGPLRARQVVLALGAYDAAVMRLPHLEHAHGMAVTFDLPDAFTPSAPAGPVAHGDGRTAGPLPLAGPVGVAFQPHGSGWRAVVSGGASPAAQAGAASAGVDPDREADVERLRAAGAWFVPALADAAVGSVWRGVRARRPTGKPVVRSLRPGLTLFGALAGRGFLCGPLLARRLAGALVERLRG